mgnify:CR=1 FL=1
MIELPFKVQAKMQPEPKSLLLTLAEAAARVETEEGGKK